MEQVVISHMETFTTKDHTAVCNSSCAGARCVPLIIVAPEIQKQRFYLSLSCFLPVESAAVDLALYTVAAW